MAFYLGKESQRNLAGVHPDLVKVIGRAIKITKIDFGVTEGKRKIAQQKRLFQIGETTTLSSLHLTQPDGFSHAVDLYTRNSKGRVTWEHKYFRWVIQAVFTAAIELGVQIEAGGLWRDFLDSPHIQLNQKYR